MRHGMFIPAGIVRLLALSVLVLIGLAVAREYPEVQRYLKAERM